MQVSTRWQLELFKVEARFFASLINTAQATIFTNIRAVKLI